MQPTLTRGLEIQQGVVPMPPDMGTQPRRVAMVRFVAIVGALLVTCL
jgi:hypothetical protein